MQEVSLVLYFLPGVVALPTIPEYRRGCHHVLRRPASALVYRATLSALSSTDCRLLSVILYCRPLSFIHCRLART